MTETFKARTISARIGWRHVQATWFLIKNRWVLVGAVQPFSKWFGGSPEDSERELKRRKIPFKWAYGEKTLS